MLVDASYLTFKTAGYPGAKRAVTEWANKGAQFYFDSPTNIRVQAHPWYKANREHLDPRTEILKVQAKALQRWMVGEFPNACFWTDGYEGDDLIAEQVLAAVGGNEVVIAEDKDFLQLPGAWLWTVRGDPWGIERMAKSTKLPLTQGRRFVAYQLLYGDVADNIPRLLLSKDIYTGKQIFATSDPLLAAIEMLPENKVRASLECLLMPSPLFTGSDAITQALAMPF